MLIDGILWVLLALALVGLAVLLVRKLPVLKAIDTTALAELKLRRVKRSIVESRLRRKLTDWRKATTTVVQPLFSHVVRPVVLLGGKLHQFEEWATAELRQRRSSAYTTHELLGQAQAAVEADEHHDAERTFLEVLRQNPLDLRAYEGLGELYLAQRDYEQAGEVYQFLVKRAGTAAAYLGLGRVAAGQGKLVEAQVAYRRSLELEDSVASRLECARVLHELGDPRSAWEQASAALTLEPTNPKILDFFIELSIVNGRVPEAQSALDTLRQVNPDNQKISEFARDIRELAHKVKPKRTTGARKSESFGLPVRGGK